MMLATTVLPRDPRGIASRAARIALTGVLAAALLLELQAGTGGLEYGLLVGAGLLIYNLLRLDASNLAE